MNFEAELDSSEWTLDDSVPIRVYGGQGVDDPEYIFEMPLNASELCELLKEVNKALRVLKKVRRSK